MRNKLTIIIIIFLGIVLYSLTFRGVLGNPQPKQIQDKLSKPGSPFESSHEKSPYALILAQTSYGKSNLSKELADFGSPDVSYHDGKFYSYFPAGLPFILIPFYDIGFKFNLAQIFTYLPMPIFGILSMIFIFLICRNTFKIPTWAAILAAIVFAFGTTSWGYAITIYQHIATTFFLVSSFYAVWKFSPWRKTSIIYAAYIWFTYGFVIFLDYPNAILFLPVMIYFFVSSFKIIREEENFNFKFNPMIIVTSIIFVVLMTMHGYYNYVNYGSWTKFAQSFPRYHQGNLKTLEKNEVDSKKTNSISLTNSAISNFKEQNIVTGTFELLVADDKGIFFYTPILLFAIFGIIKRSGKLLIEKSVLVSIFLVNLLMYASFADPYGGWAYGPRYLIPSMAILAILALSSLVNFRFKLLSKIVFFGLFIYSSGIALLGVLTTNVIPPKIEAIPEHLKYYNYLLNIEALKNNTSGSILYNLFFSKYINLIGYYGIILSLILIIVFLLLFVPPLLTPRTNKHKEKINV